jgi:hypothetical protein
MINPLDRWRQRQARRKYMPNSSRGRAGTTAKLAAVALVAILAVAAVLEMRKSGGPEIALIEYVRDVRQEPLDLIEAAARSHRLVFLADINAAAAPKRFAALAIQKLATTSGLDFVVFDVDANEQPFIDLYLATSPEDASILLGRPRAIREGDPSSRAFLDLYSAIWKVNQQLGADRRIRIIAADLAGWPPARAASPNERAVMFGKRDEQMLEAVRTRALGRNSNARILFFVDGLHALKNGGGRIQAGGTRPVDVTWLAAGLAALFPQDVYTILTDAPLSGAATTSVAAYSGTAMYEVFRKGGVRAGSAFTLGAAEFDALSRNPIRAPGTTGLEFNFEPRDTPLSQLADAYIYFGG